MKLISSLIFGITLLADTGGLTDMPTVGTPVDITSSASGPFANPSFETGAAQPDGWAALPSGWVWENNASLCHSGNRCLSRIGTASSYYNSVAWAFQRRTIFYKLWVKASADPGAVNLSISQWDSTHGASAAYLTGGAGFSNSLSGLTVWTQLSGTASLLPEEHFNDNVSLRLTVPALPDGVTLYVDDISLWYEPRSLGLMVTYPNYRGMLWPDQGNTITWKSVVGNPTPTYTIAALKVRVEVVRVSDSAIMATITDETLDALGSTPGVAWVDYSINDGSYDASGLADTSYYLRATLRRISDDVAIYTHPDYKIVKEAVAVQRSSWQVWVDKYQRVVINQTPRFIWGTYWNITATYNVFPAGSASTSTNADAYRRLAMGCQRTGASCDESIPSLTWWNHGYGLTGHSLIKTMADLRMNAVIYYSPMSGGNAGINTTTCATYVSGSDTINPFLTALQDFDIWHLHIVVEYWPGSGYPPPFWAACTDGETGDVAKGKRAVKELVNFAPAGGSRLGDQPGFLGLYISDEPGITSTYEGLTASFHKSFSFKDQNLGGLSYYVPGPAGYANIHFDRWYQFMDSAGPDPYPTGGLISDDYAFGVAASPRHGRSYRWPRRVAQQQFDARPLIPVTQLFYYNGSFPDYKFEKIQLVSSLAAGATGILHWQHGSSGFSSRTTEARYQEHQRSAKLVADQLEILNEQLQDVSDGPQGLGAVIASISSTPTVNSVKCSSRRKDTRLLLACANTTTTEQSTTITLQTPGQAAVALKLWDASTVSIGAGAFTDTFKSLQDATVPENSVHLYLIETAPAGSRTRAGL